MTVLTRVERQTYTLDEVLKMLGISRTRGYRMAQQNQLPVEPLKIGRTYRFRKSDVDELLRIGPEQGRAA
ncbi:hypothetical protein BH23CHL4_BH23CHL4_07950 [soil metagenome]